MVMGFLEILSSANYFFHPLSWAGFFVAILALVFSFLMAYLEKSMATLKRPSAGRFLRIVFLLLALGLGALSLMLNSAPWALKLFWGLMLIFGVMTSWMFFMVRETLDAFQKTVADLHQKLQHQSSELSRIVGELQATQIKLFETGKVSALATLSAGILHQISQPLTAIHGFVRFIKKEMKPEEPFYKPISLMEEQSQYLKAMLEDLMELIRHREIKKESIQVNACLQRAMNLLTDELRINRVNWDLVLEENLPLIYADGVHLQQVFMNIVINAIQAMGLLPRGSLRYIKITSQYDKNQSQVAISFRDTGPGLSLEDQRQIFDPFFSTKIKGAGIGLALCKDLVAEHGGTIELVSLPREGANFIVKLPVAGS